MINYSIAMRPNPLDENAPKKAYAQAQSIQTLDINAFAKHISDHGCVYDRGDIANILTKAVDCMKENLLNGNRVQLAELGTFSISLNSKGVEDPKDFTAANITNVNVIWTPGNEFKDLIKDAQFNPVPTRKATAKLLAAQKAGETIVDLTDTDEDAPNGGGNNGGGGGNTSNNGGGSGNQNGSQQQNPPAGGGTTEKYTVTYKHEGATYTTQEYEVGETVTPPAAPDGYIWLNVPSSMPARNVICESYESGDPNDI